MLEAGEVDILVANAGLPAAGRLESFTIERDRPRARRQPARADRARPRARAGHDRAGPWPPAVHVLARRQGRHARQTAIYNATKFGLRGFAAALRADLHDSGVGVSAVFPGFIRDAGMFADSGVKLPPGVGTR